MSDHIVCGSSETYSHYAYPHGRTQSLLQVPAEGFLLQAQAASHGKTVGRMFRFFHGAALLLKAGDL